MARELCIQDGCEMVDLSAFGSNCPGNFAADSQLAKLAGGNQKSGGVTAI